MVDESEVVAYLHVFNVGQINQHKKSLNIKSTFLYTKNKNTEKGTFFCSEKNKTNITYIKINIKTYIIYIKKITNYFSIKIVHAIK